MAHNQILSIYCSKEDCITISKEKKKSLPGIHLDTTVIKTKFSLRKVYSYQQKQYALKKSDYVIAIDYPARYVFIEDYEAENLLHFVSLHHFYEWLDGNFAKRTNLK